MKYGAIIPAVILELAAVYCVHMALTLNQGTAPFILRIIAALILGYFGYVCYRDFQKTRETHLRKWCEKDREKGVLVYALIHGVLGYGIPVGYISWVLQTEFEYTQDPLLFSAILTLIPFSLMGFFIGWYTWSQLKKEAEKLGLC